MEYKWINKQNNKNLIVFFNGWGMNERIVSSLGFQNFDVLVFYDYRNFELGEFNFSQYENKNLAAWSLGVYVCNNFYSQFSDFGNFVAINGTQKPVDDNFGIPEKIYNLTVDNFNELSCRKFMKKISSDINIQDYCSRNCNELKEELISIRDLKPNKFFKFNKAYVSLNDKIIPAKNQINFWEKEGVEVIKLDKMHYIFDSFKNWSDLL